MPKLETDIDRNREELIINNLRTAFPNSTFSRYNAHEYAGLDWVVTAQEKAICVIELKCRQTKSTDYSTVFCARRKYNSLLQAHSIYGTIPIFMASFADGLILGVNVLQLANTSSGTITRTKPRASGLVGMNDREDVLLVNISEMKVVSKLTNSELSRYIDSENASMPSFVTTFATTYFTT